MAVGGCLILVAVYYVGAPLLTAVLVDLPARANDPLWVKTVREGRIPESLDVDAASAWPEVHLMRGQTSRTEVVRILGEPVRDEPSLPHSLDRPQRDGVDVYQYDLWGNHNGPDRRWLVVHIDSDKEVLVDWGISGSVCGFCPHVFAFDGRWRLEGKMLAGCVGEQRTGTETLLLPRLTSVGGSLALRLANLAPETDYVMEASLAAVPLSDDEELDISATGDLVVWRPVQEIPLVLTAAADGTSVATVEIDPRSASDVLALEVRNTFAFESAMRHLFIDGRKSAHQPALTIDFGEGQLRAIDPPCETEAIWQTPSNSYAQCLSPMQQTALVFPGRVGRTRSDHRGARDMRSRCGGITTLQEQRSKGGEEPQFGGRVSAGGRLASL